MKINDVPQSILSLLLQTAVEKAWPLPETLMKPLLPVLAFDPEELLPDVLRERVKDVAYRMQSPIEYVAVSAVCMLGSVIGTGCAIRPKQKDDWTEVPNLWGAVVGRPGKLKTPAISAGLSPLSALEADAERTYQAEIAAYQLEVVERKLSTEMVKKQLGKIKDEEALKQSAQMERLKTLNQPIEGEPKLRRYRTNDSTVEKLGESLTTNTRGILVYRDELIGLLKGFEQHGHEGDRAFYLEGWNGRHSYRVDRIGRGEIYIPHLCLSVFGGIQPAKLQDYLFQVKQGGNDGLLQRFQLLVFPDDISDPKIIDQEPDRDAAEALVTIVKKLAATDFGTVGASRDHPDDIAYIRFKPDVAQPMFFQWLSDLDRMVMAEDDPILQEHFTKYRKLVPTLALIFHVFEWAKKSDDTLAPIGAKSLKLAIAWAEYLASHARRIYGMGLDLKVTAAEALARKLQDNTHGPLPLLSLKSLPCSDFDSPVRIRSLFSSAKQFNLTIILSASLDSLRCAHPAHRSRSALVSFLSKIDIHQPKEITMFMMGCVIFFSVLLIMIKLPQRMLLRMLHYDLLIDFAVSFLVLFLHWGSFEGVMVATIAGLMTSVATSGAKRLFGCIKGRTYYPGYMTLKLGAK